MTSAIKLSVIKNFYILGLLFLSTSISAQSNNKIIWYSLEDAVVLSEKEPKKIFIDVMTVWCGWCKKMDREVFSQAEIIDLLNEQYYAVRLDAQQKEDIKFKGETFEYEIYGQKGFNRFAVELLRGKMGFPSLVFLDEEFNIIQALEGYQPANRLASILGYFGKDVYKQTPWSTYVRSINAQIREDAINLNSIKRVGGKN